VELNAIRVLEVLRNKGVKHLHHANTVRTSCTFLRDGRLLARGVVEDRGLPQTPQKSDAKDKNYGVWCDVFLDGVDIHERAAERCDYGPVLFVFDIKVLETSTSVWVTKTNPIYWQNGQSQSGRYFASVTELDASYQYGDFGKSIVLRNTAGMLRLKPFLEKILLDNPNRTDGTNVDLFSQAMGALRASAQAGPLDRVAIKARVCKSGCGCRGQYEDMKDADLKTLFVP
jgi:hypothetical protein